MIIVNPTETTHTISIVSRYDLTKYTDELLAFVDRVKVDGGTTESLDCLYGSNLLILSIKDSFKGESTDVENTFVIENGKLSVTFDYDFRVEGRYEITISNEDDTEVAYRGIILATSQETQEYKLTNDKFYY
jgi:hypothetical protein